MCLLKSYFKFGYLNLSKFPIHLSCIIIEKHNIPIKRNYTKLILKRKTKARLNKKN